MCPTLAHKKDSEWNRVRPFPPSLSNPSGILDSFGSRSSVNDRAAFIMRPARMVCDPPGVLLKRGNRSTRRIVLTRADLRANRFERRRQFPIATSASIRKILPFPVAFVSRQVHDVEAPAAHLCRSPIAHHAALWTWYVILCPVTFGPIGYFPNRFEGCI
jgi:hypothetical protein